MDASSTWFAVRCVFGAPDEDPSSDQRWYEERITIWAAASIDEAIAQAEVEAAAYAEILELEDLGFAQAFELSEGVLTSGTEVFSLIRGSALAPDAYLDAFFDTGAELQQQGIGDEADQTET